MFAVRRDNILSTVAYTSLREVARIFPASVPSSNSFRPLAV
jgi:hypothetical protein